MYVEYTVLHVMTVPDYILKKVAHMLVGESNYICLYCVRDTVRNVWLLSKVPMCHLFNETLPLLLETA